MSNFTVKYLFFSLALCCACTGGGNQPHVDPRYSQVKKDGNKQLPDLEEIQRNGEIIMLTLSGAESYFEFRGGYFGVQYLIASHYAKSIGVGMRVEVCRDTTEMVNRLLSGEGDIIMYALSEKQMENYFEDSRRDLSLCGGREVGRFVDSLLNKHVATEHVSGWIVRQKSVELARSLNSWLCGNSSHFKDYTTLFSHARRNKFQKPVNRHSAKFILNQAKGQISLYDNLFKQYAPICNWDWRLLSAQSFQESAFNPDAVSWMGAMGLMQLMPATARDLGVDEDEAFEPEVNIQASVKLINQLDRHYSYIDNKLDRICFILASYNAGPGHIDDARALAEKNGRNANIWQGNVDEYVLNMSKREYYNDPVVLHGYFRGSETYDYVNNIIRYWEEYKLKIR